MASPSLWSAIGALLSSAGQSTNAIAVGADERAKEEERIARQKKLDSQHDIEFSYQQGEIKKADEAKDSGGQKIRTAMQELQSPSMNVQDATQVVQQASPDQIAEAHGYIAKAAAAQPNDGMPVMQASAPVDTPEQVKSKFMAAVDQQESGNNANQKEHPRAANGYQAYGKHGIVPELHIDRIGLDPTNPEDIAKWKADPKLQDATFEKIVDSIGKANNWDPARMRVAYYGKTKNPDAQQHLADGRAMPSSNEDTSRFMQVYDKTAASDNPPEVQQNINLANTGRAAMETIMNSKVPPAQKKDAARKTLTKLYQTMTPDELSQNKSSLDAIAEMAHGEDADNARAVQQQEEALNRQAQVAMKAASLDENWQAAQAKIKAGAGHLLGDEERKAIENHMKSLQDQRKGLEDAAARLAVAKQSGQQGMLAARPDITSQKPQGFMDRLFNRTPEYQIDSPKIESKMKQLDDLIQLDQNALAGIGRIPSQAVPAAAAPTSDLSKYLTPK